MYDLLGFADDFVNRNRKSCLYEYLMIEQIDEMKDFEIKKIFDRVWESMMDNCINFELRIFFSPPFYHPKAEFNDENDYSIRFERFCCVRITFQQSINNEEILGLRSMIVSQY